MSTATRTRPPARTGLAGESAYTSFRIGQVPGAGLHLRAADAGGDGTEFEGIAVPWDVEIDVYGDGWMTEVWRRGAFNHQLSAANRIKVGRDHIPMGGSLIGSLREMRNDPTGLWVRGKISKTVDGLDTLQLMADEALDELSIGFYRVAGGDIRTTNDQGGTLYDMRKANLFEVAILPWGAYGQDATVTDLRSALALAGLDAEMTIVIAGRPVRVTPQLRALVLQHAELGALELDGVDEADDQGDATDGDAGDDLPPLSFGRELEASPLQHVDEILAELPPLDL